MARRWLLPEVDHAQAGEVAAGACLPMALAEVLVRRGIVTADAARAFLHPTMDQLHSPWLLRGMREAVARLRQAILDRERILIYGDYDVDGTTATVLLKTAIDRVSLLTGQAAGESLVRFHIPHRIREGYGMQAGVLAGAAEAGVKLVISVDTGIRAFAASEEASVQGMDLIVTDHHLPEEGRMPEAVAVINPNQPGCAYPFKEICGAAVAFKLAQALLLSVCEDGEGFRAVQREALDEKLLPSFLKLLAIATIADSMPLEGENRAIVTLGLEQLRKPAQGGLRALMRLSNFEFETNGSCAEFTARDVAFRIAPRINAAGRMDTASDVVNLFLTRDAAEGERLAEKLHQLNSERRDAEAAILAEIEERIAAMRAADPALESHGVMVMDGEGWHRGVVGILASRVLERTLRPALVLSHEDGVAHGSGRSLDGFHLLDALTAVDEMAGEKLFERYGGHAHAVGFAMASEKIPLLKERLAAYSKTHLSTEMLEPPVVADGTLTLGELNGDFVAAVRKLEPFGHGNPEPVFLVERAQLAAPVQALKERHAKLRLRQDDGAVTACVCWARTEPWPPKLRAMGVEQDAWVDVLVKVRENDHPDFGGPEMELVDIRT